MLPISWFPPISASLLYTFKCVSYSYVTSFVKSIQHGTLYISMYYICNVMKYYKISNYYINVRCATHLLMLLILIPTIALYSYKTCFFTL